MRPQSYHYFEQLHISFTAAKQQTFRFYGPFGFLALLFSAHELYNRILAPEQYKNFSFTPKLLWDNICLKKVTFWKNREKPIFSKAPHKICFSWSSRKWRVFDYILLHNFNTRKAIAVILVHKKCLYNDQEPHRVRIFANAWKRVKKCGKRENLSWHTVKFSLSIILSNLSSFQNSYLTCSNMTLVRKTH